MINHKQYIDMTRTLVSFLLMLTTLATCAGKETLPAARLQQGKATLIVRLTHGYPAQSLSLHVSGFTPLGQREPFDEYYPFPTDGRLTANVPLRLVRTVTVGIDGLGETSVVLSPNETTEIDLDLHPERPLFSRFRGYMARTNTELWRDRRHRKATEHDRDFSIYTALSQCHSPEERIALFRQRLQHERDSISRQRLTPATKALLRMRAESEMLYAVGDFGNYNIDLLDRLSIEKRPDEYEPLMARYKQYTNMLYLDNDERLRLFQSKDFELSSAPYAPASPDFTHAPLYTNGDDHSYLHDLYVLRFMASGPTDSEYLTQLRGMIHSDDCLALADTLLTRLHDDAVSMNHRPGVFVHTLDSVSPERLVETLRSRYPGHAIVLSLIYTWRENYSPYDAFQSLKDAFIGKPVVFLYLADGSTSPFYYWRRYVESIPGQHYYVTWSQLDYLRQHVLHAPSIPCRALFAPDATITWQNHDGDVDITELREAIVKALGD